MEIQKAVIDAFSRNIVIADLSISVWSAAKTDKAVTAEVHAQHNAHAGAGRYRKNLMPKNALKDVQKAASDLRAVHHSLTNRHNEDGGRKLPTRLHQEYVSKMSGAIARFDSAADEFALNYPRYVDEARTILGDMFDANQYPDAGDIRGKFKAEYTLSPFPVSGDFERTGLDKDIIDSLGEQLEQAAAKQISDYQAELWARLREPLAHLCERVSDPENIIHASSVENLRDMIEAIHKLNILDDEGITRIANLAFEKAASYEVEDLRKDVEIRKEVAKNCADILDQMSFYTGMVGSAGAGLQ